MLSLLRVNDISYDSRLDETLTHIYNDVYRGIFPHQ